jgi:hypothetical protein
VSTGTRSLEFIDALVSTFRGISGFSAPGGAGVPVYDGPVESGHEPPLLVVVGATSPFGYDDSDDTAATTDAEWVSVPIQAGSRRESVSVRCAVAAWTGNASGGAPDWAALRASIDSTLDALAGSLNTPNAIGLAGVISLTLSGGTLSQEFTQDGAMSTFAFNAEGSFLL